MSQVMESDSWQSCFFFKSRFKMAVYYIIVIYRQSGFIWENQIKIVWRTSQQ